MGHSLPMRLVPRLARCPEYPESRHEAPAQYLTRWAMCGRLRVGKENLHVTGLVGAAMCSAC